MLPVDLGAAIVISRIGDVASYAVNILKVMHLKTPISSTQKQGCFFRLSKDMTVATKSTTKIVLWFLSEDLHIAKYYLNFRL